MNGPDIINSWEDLEADIEDLFNNPQSITGRKYGHAYAPLKALVEDLKNNQEKHKTNPETFSDSILRNVTHTDNLFDWLPYITGARAKLLDIKFYDKNKNEITDKSQVSKIVQDNDPVVTNETYILIVPNFERVEELNKGSQDLKLSNKQDIVYADINRPGYNLEKMKKKLK